MDGQLACPQMPSSRGPASGNVALPCSWRGALEVGLLFRKVHDTGLQATGGEQEPFTYGAR